jgi:hypothetical protein
LLWSILAARTITAVDSRIDDTSPPIASRPDVPIATSARSADRRPIFSLCGRDADVHDVDERCDPQGAWPF